MNNQFTLEELKVIRNCITEQILEIGHRQSWGYEQKIEALLDLRLKVDRLAGYNPNK